MSREIKFRAWDKELGFYEDDENIFINQNGAVYREDEGEWYKDRYEIQMFTGVNDKNGKVVYEGDVVRAWSQGFTSTFQIKWREDGGGSQMFILYPAWKNREMWHISSSREKDGMCYDRGLEVIGNIYENPELLKELCVK
jgi:uncharacterized phage protein (TIGR01671 family)